MFHPVPNPRFSASTTFTSGNRSRTNARVPSLEPWSTTTVSTRSESRHCSIHGNASYVTTTAATRGASPMLDLRTSATAQPLAQHDHSSGECEQQGDQEVQETRGEGLIRADPDASEEAHEERLPHGETVQRERHEHDEEEERSEDVVDPRVEVDADSPGCRP